jgi:hypothetical protein
MYNPTFHTVIAEARLEDLLRSRGTSRQSRRRRADRDPRPAARWGLITGAGIRRLVFADPSRAN